MAAAVGDPARVVRPAHAAGVARRVDVEVADACRDVFAVIFDLDQRVLTGLVGSDDLLAVRRPLDAVPEAALLVGELDRLAVVFRLLAVALGDVEVVLAVLVAGEGDPLAVGAPGGIAVGGTVAGGQAARHAFFGRQGEDVAAGFDDDLLAGRADAAAAKVVRRVHGHRPQGRLRAGDLHLDLGRLGAFTQAKQVQAAAHLVDDFALAVGTRAHAGVFHVPVGGVGELATLAAFGIKFEKVELAACFHALGGVVREVVELAVEEHRGGVGAFPVGGALAGFIVDIEHPDVGRHAAAVTFPGAGIARVGRVGEGFAVFAQAGRGAVGHGELARHRSGLPAALVGGLQVDCVQLRRVDQLVVHRAGTAGHEQGVAVDPVLEIFVVGMVGDA